jgi:hypothetical protein
MTATKAAARAEKTKAEKEEDAKWRTCPGCAPLQRRVVNVGGAILMCAHNAWSARDYRMLPCPGSGQPPTPQAEDAPVAVFTAEDN